MTDPVNGDLGGDFSTFVGSSSPSAIAGYGSITVPAGYVGPLPVGVTFIAGRWDEPTLIGFAYDFEQATQVRKAPTFLASTSASAARPNKGHRNDNVRSADQHGRHWHMLPLR